MATNNRELLPNHLHDLRQSGLRDDTIATCGFVSVTDAKVIGEKLNWPGDASDLGPCLGIPFHDPKGVRTGFGRFKPDHPRIGKDGKKVKYESPKGAPNRVYFPPLAIVIAALADPTCALLITEGEKKAAAAAQAGFPCIGLVGVWGWQKKRRHNAQNVATGKRLLLDELDQLVWKGRKVFIVFDSDATTKPAVQTAERNLAAVLAKKGAI